MVQKAVELIKTNTTIHGPAIPELPKRITSVEKPDKAEAIRNHRSRFKLN